MTNKNNVNIFPEGFYGYIDDSTPRGKAKAEQVKADMEALATILSTPNLTKEIKLAVYYEYPKAIKKYVEQEETSCCGCHDSCDCECDCEEEEEGVITVGDVMRYCGCDCEDEAISISDVIRYLNRHKGCDCKKEKEVSLADLKEYAIRVDDREFYYSTYSETIEAMKKLDELGFDYISVLGYTADDREVYLTITKNSDEFSLAIL